MSRLFLASAIIAALCAADRLLPLLSAADVSAQSQSGAASINNEPNHKRLLYTNDLRLWEVTLPPGQSTLPFIQDHDVATIVIGDGMLNIQRNGEQVSPPAPNARGSVIVAEHTGASATYRIDNHGTTEYRALEIENMHEGSWAAAQPFTAAGTSVLKESRAFTIYDVQLKAGAPNVMHNHTGSTIVALIGGVLQQEGIGGTDAVRIQQPGQWLALPRFQAHVISAAGSGDAHAIEIEVR